MATKPELKRAVPRSKIKAVDYNRNFDSLNNYIEQGIADNAINNFEFDRTYIKGDWVLANVQGHNALYESLRDGNRGNSVENSTYWKPVVTGGNYLFDLKISDHDLYGEEALGWALQGTYVSDSIYPNFCGRCFMEKEQAIPMETEIEGNTITLYKHDNGHVFYDIADKGVIDILYEKTGMAWYYGIDLDSLRVFLPRDKYFYVKGNVAIAGNGMTLGLTNGTLLGGLYPSTDEKYLRGATGGYGLSVGENIPDGTIFTGGKMIGITTDSTKSGIEGKLETQENKYLYICVGNTVLNPEYVDVANLSSDLQFKADKTDVDGQWVYSEYIVFEGVTLTSTLTIYDVSNYLPDDTNSYEVQILFEGHNSSYGTTMALYSDENKTQEIFRVRTLKNDNNSGGSGLTVFLGGNRKIYAGRSGSHNLTACKLTFFAYRRLGTNN